MLKTIPSRRKRFRSTNSDAQAGIGHQNSKDTRPATQKQLADLNMVLGDALRKMTGDKRASSLDAAITAYRTAIAAYKRSSVPSDWAAAQNKLATHL